MFRLYPERIRRARPTLPAKSIPIPSSSGLCASAFSSPNVDARDAASSISPLSAALTKNTRGWMSVAIVNPIFQFNRRFISNSHRIIFFAHPYPLTPIESYSCKKQGGGVGSRSRAVSFRVTSRHAGTLATPIPSRVYFITSVHPGGPSAVLLCVTSAHSAPPRLSFSFFFFVFQLSAVSCQLSAAVLSFPFQLSTVDCQPPAISQSLALNGSKGL